MCRPAWRGYLSSLVALAETGEGPVAAGHGGRGRGARPARRAASERVAAQRPPGRRGTGRLTPATGDCARLAVRLAHLSAAVVKLKLGASNRADAYRRAEEASWL